MLGLVYREPRAIPSLVLLAEKEGRVGTRALEALGYFDDPRVLPVLRKFAAQGSFIALHSLGNLRDRESIPLILEALNSRNSSTRLFAAQALERLPDPRSVPVLIAVLERELPLETRPGSSQSFNVSSIVRTLAATGDPRAVPVFLSRVEAVRRPPEPKSTEWSGPMFERELQIHPFAHALCHLGIAAFPELVK